MKKLFAIAFALMIGCSVTLPATPFSYQFFNSDGTAQTNRILMQAWPPATNTWTVYGTNVIYGGQIITLDPNSSGYGTNYAYPNTYRLFLSNLNSGFFISLPDTSSQIALGSCLISAPQVAGPLGFFGMVTNWLGYMPATNNAAGIKFALGYTPATNSLPGITNALGYTPPNSTYASLTNSLGLDPASNNAAGIKFALGYTPPTNSYVSLTNALGLDPASNNAAGIKFALGYTPATNSLVGITNAIGFMPLASNVVLTASVLPQIGYIGVTNLNATMLTNWATGTIICWTNLAIGTAPTLGAPDGSLLVATNGNTYVRSNATWVNLK